MPQDVNARLEALRAQPMDQDAFVAALAEPTTRASALALRADAVTGAESARLWCAVADLRSLDEYARRDALGRAGVAALADGELWQHLARALDARGAVELLDFARPCLDRAALPDAVVSWLGALLDAADDDADRALIWRAVVRVDATRAPAALADLGALASSDDDATADAVLEIARATGDDRTLLRVLDQRARATDPARRDGLLAELVPLAWNVTQDPDVAIDYLADALDDGVPSAGLEPTADLLAASCPPSARLMALRRRIAEDNGDIAGVARLSAQLAEMSDDPAARAALHLDAGDLLAKALDLDGALERWAEAVRAAPAARAQVTQRLDALEQTEAVRRLRRSLVEEAGDWEALHALFNDDLSRADGHDALQLLWRRFALERAQLDRPDLAIATLDELERRFDDDDTRQRVTASLADLSQEPRVLSDVVTRLEPRLRAAERWEELAALVARDAESLADAATRSARHAEAADLLATRLSREHEALVQLDLALDLAPSRVDLWDRARQLRLTAGDIDGALRLIVREYARAQDEDRKRILDAERARILERHRGVRAAIDDAFSSLDEHPDAAAVRTVFAELLGRSGALDEVRSLARDVGGRGDDTRAAALLWRAAETVGASTDEGVSLGFDAAIVGAPDPVRLHALADIVRDRSVADEQLRLRRLLAERAPAPADRVTARRELAEQLASSGDHEGAMAQWRELIDIDMSDERAHRGLIAAALAAERPADAASAIEALLQHVRLDDDATVDALQQLSMLYDAELGRADLAYDAARRVLGLRPQDSRAAMAVQDYAHTGGEALGAFYTLRDTLAHLDEGPRREARHLEIAELATSTIDDASLALPHWEAVAAGETLNVEDRRRATRYAIDAAVADERWDDVVRFGTVDLTLNEGVDRTERAEWLVDMLVDRHQRDAALQLARTATESPAAHDVFLLDRRATLAAMSDDDDDARAALAAWHELDPSTMPLDRRARLARLLLIADGDDETGRSLAAGVLRDDPDQPELVRALGDATPSTRSRVAEQLADTDDDRVLTRRASLYTVDDPDGDDAVAAWRAVLDRDPRHEQALAYLEHALKHRDDRAGLAALHRHRAEHLEDDDDGRAHALRRVATLEDDPERREQALVDLLALDLGDEAARADLASLYRDAERWDDLAAHLDETAGVLSDHDAILATLDALADVRVQHLDDAAGAVDALERKVDVRPLDPATLDRLIELYAMLDRPEARAQAMLKRATMHEDEDRRADALRTAAREFERLGNPQAALDALRRVLAFAPAHLTVLEEMARLHGELGAWDASLEALERLAAASGVRELRAEIYVRAARVMHEYLGRHRDALELLSRAVESIPHDPEITELVRACGRAAEAWVPLAGVLRQIAISAPDDAPWRLELEAEVGRTLDENADDPSAALSWLLECFRRRPEPGPVLDELEALATRRALRTHLVEVYKRLATAAEDPEVRWRGFLGSASVAERDIGRPDVAFDVVARAATEPQLAERAEQELERIAGEHDLWDRHRAWLDDRVASAGDDMIEQVIHKARVEETQVGDWEAAFETLVSAYQDIPGPGPLRDELYRVADEHNAWELVLKLYELLQQQSEGETRRGHLLEMARVAREQLDDVAGGFTHTLRAWQLSPADEALRDALVEAAEAADRRVDLLAAWEWEARQSQLDDERVPALERCVALADELDLVDRSVAARREIMVIPGRTADALDALDERLADDEHRALFATTLDRAAHQISDRSDRVRVRVRQAEVLSELDDSDGAAAALEDALTFAPEPEPVRDRLIDVLRTLGAWERLAAQLEARLARDDDSDRAALEIELGEVYLDRLGDTSRATSVFRRAALDHRDDSRPHERYVAHLRALDRFDDLVEYLVDAAGSRDEADRRAMLLEAAQISEESLDDPRRAIRIVDRLLTDESDIDALALRARALGTLNRWNDHVDTLRRIADASSGRPAAEALAQAAEALETQLFYGERAADTWRRAAETDPGWAHACRELGRLLAEHGRYDEARDALQDALQRRRADENASPWEIADDATALARLLDQHTPDAEVETLRELLEAAIASDPHHAEALTLYEDVLERSGGVERLLELLDGELEEADNDEARARVLVRRALVYHFDAGRTSDARKALDRAVELAPDSPAPIAAAADIALHTEALGEAARRYDELFGNWAPLPAEQLVKTRPLIAGEGLDRDIALAYLVRAAVAAERAGRVDDAYDRFAAVNIEDEANLAALHGLARLSMLRGNLAGASVHVTNFLRHGDAAPTELRSEMQELAGTIAEQDGDLARALAMYDAAASSISGAAEKDAVARAADVALRSGNARAAIPRLERLSGLTDNPAERADTLARLARAQVDAGSDPAEAARTVQQALVIAPVPTDAIDAALDDVLAALGIEARIATLDGMLDVVESAAKRGRLMHRRARAEREREGDWTEALATRLAAALGVLPTSPPLLADVIEAFGELENHKQLARVLGSAVDRCTGDDAQTARILDALASLRHEHLGDTSGAIDALVRLRDLAPGDDSVAERLLTLLVETGAGDDALLDALCTQLVSAGRLSETLLDAVSARSQAADDLDGVLYALLVRDLAGSLDEADRDLLASVPTDAPEAPAGGLTIDLLTDGDAAAALHPAVVQRLAALSEYVEGDGDDGTPTEPEGPLAVALDRVARACGHPPPALVRDDAQSAGARVFSLDPPALSVSGRLADADVTDATIALAGACLRLRPEFAALDVLSAWEYLAFYEAAVEPLSDAPAVLDDELRERIAVWHERFGDDAAPAESGLDARYVPGVGAFRDHVDALSARAAALLSGDPAATFRSVLQQHFESAPGSVDGLRALCARIPAARSLITWLLDGGYARARAALANSAAD